jgi:HPt (histidine-containing phosphotransfer) domain-containing protein
MRSSEALVGLAEPWQASARDSEDTAAALERVRQSFHARLEGERLRLASLAKALKAARGDAVILSDIEMFAHRLRGAAATFEVPELSADAKALELAAAANEPSLWSALETLAARLSLLSGGPTRATRCCGVSPIAHRLPPTSVL